MKKEHKILEAYAKTNPRNCPVIEYTADGDNVGVCCFYLNDGKTCPRHGIVKNITEESIKISIENKSIMTKIKEFLKVKS